MLSLPSQTVMPSKGTNTDSCEQSYIMMRRERNPVRIRPLEQTKRPVSTTVGLPVQLRATTMTDELTPQKVLSPQACISPVCGKLLAFIMYIYQPRTFGTLVLVRIRHRNGPYRGLLGLLEHPRGV
jgi:hypothetical protein